jgi:hypothetical protein
MSRAFLRTGFRVAAAFGINPRTTIRALRNVARFTRDMSSFRQMTASAETRLPWAGVFPCLVDRDDESGNISGHYFHQDLLVARRIFERRPERHIDVASRVDGFVAHVAVFRTIEVLDVRPLTGRVPNIRFTQADLFALPSQFAESTDSLSCLHALEHFGLGRYGDSIDPDGHIKGLNALRTMLRTGGTLYLSVPIGRSRIEFNAHRVFSLEYMSKLIAPHFDVRAFSYVDDRGDLHENVDLDTKLMGTSDSWRYACGIFELVRR